MTNRLAPAGPGATTSVARVVRDLVTRPWQAIVLRWNWKSACVSSVVRAAVFFLTNLTAGLEAAGAAFLTEWGYRALTAGFYGGMTQAFRDAEPTWLATLTAMIVLPASSHGLEYVVHSWRRTPNLATSIGVSIVFTAVSTLFNLHAMRRGVLIVGDGRASLADDLRALPRLWWRLLIAPVVRVGAIAGRVGRRPPAAPAR